MYFLIDFTLSDLCGSLPASGALQGRAKWHWSALDHGPRVLGYNRGLQNQGGRTLVP
jgi:hypothetical protein